MKRNLLVLLLLLTAGFVSGQTYYWVGNSKTNFNSFTNNSNWNSSLDGTGSPRATATTADILIIDGSNVGGTTPTTGLVTFDLTSVGIGQLKLQNNAKVVMKRTASGTATVTINGNSGDDLVIDNTSTLSVNVAANAVVISMLPAATGRISGTFEIGNGAHRLVSQTAGALIFANGSSAVTNITGTTYPFGGPATNPIAARNGVVFEAGANLYYDGGRSPMANQAWYQVIDFKAGSNYHFRASNTGTGLGTFFSKKSFANIFIENNATVTSDGPIYKIDNLTIESGSSFVVDSFGQTAVMGNIVVNGALKFPETGTNTLVIAGSTPQTISGTGTASAAALTVADHSELILGTDLAVANAVNVYGKIDFTGSRLTGTATFNTRVNETAIALTGDVTAGSAQISNVAGVTGLTGLTITGNGIPANTKVVSFSADSSWIILSQPAITTGTAVALNFASDTATLASAHASGFEEANGSVTLSGIKTYKSGTNYIINAATIHPFGLSSTPDEGNIRVGAVTINAPVTINRGADIFNQLNLNSKLSLRPGDTLRIRQGAMINGTFDNNHYIVTPGDAVTGSQSLVQYDDLSSLTVVPVGSPGNYLPVSITPAAASAFRVAVIEGITANGLVNGISLTDFEKQSKVNASWTIERISGAAADLQLQWNAALEGSTLATLPDAEIGIILNTGTAWGNPISTGNNAANTATASVTDFGIFSIGTVPQAEPFIFNEIPVKSYGDADFNGGASSLNSTKQIVYSSSNTAVATIVDNKIHITGAGTTTITASQETDGVYPAASIEQTLTVEKAALSIRADNKTTTEAEPLPALTATYTGFVYAETPAVLLTPVVLSTTATSASPAGDYPISVGGATATNYTISFENGVMKVLPKQTQTITFGALASKRYGNPDFTVTAISTNNSIPVTYSSSNTSVATVNGNNVHIVGAGTVTITALQAGNINYFAATPVARTLTVDKAPLTVAVRDTSKVEGQANPDFTLTYTGFVLGETAANLTAPAVVNTIATTTSSAGYYTLTPGNAVTNNYAITYLPGRLTVLPAGGADRPVLNAYMSNSTTLTTRIFSNAPALADVVLWDLNGKPFLKRNTFLPKGFISVDLMVGNVPSGIYIVTVRGSGVELEQMIRIIR